jgi:hypothetical protein
VTPTRLQYDFDFDPWFEAIARPLGVHADAAHLLIDEEDLTVQFGPWCVRTPVDNLEGATVTGPYAWPKVIGPPHLSLADGGLTMASNRRAGACIRFRRPVRGSTPFPYPRHGSLTVTVEDPASLVAAVEALVTGDASEPLSVVTEELELDLSGASASELRARARALGVPGTSRLRKAELLEVLTPHAAEDHADQST